MEGPRRKASGRRWTTCCLLITNLRCCIASTPPWRRAIESRRTGGPSNPRSVRFPPRRDRFHPRRARYDPGGDHHHPGRDRHDPRGGHYDPGRGRYPPRRDRYYPHRGPCGPGGESRRFRQRRSRRRHSGPGRSQRGNYVSEEHDALSVADHRERIRSCQRPFSQKSTSTCLDSPSLSPVGPPFAARGVSELPRESGSGPSQGGKDVSLHSAS